MDLLDAVVQPYAWGSHTIIATLQGRPVPTSEPEAEMWMGAHPAAPSGLVRDGARTDLERVVAADPAGELGAGCAERFEGRLPFLLKILAVEKALSIQVHPDRETARAGFLAEAGRGGGPATYVDDWPKPEVLCALTEFEALAGFRDPLEAADLLERLRPRGLGAVVASLRLGDAEAPLRALRAVLECPAEARDDVVASVLAGCERLAAEGGPDAAAARAYLRVGADHPGDIGLVAALLLRYRVLAPGEAIFLEAGGLHAYLRGTGVEILANSDNVLRAGLTGKHVDVEELLRITDPRVRVPDVRPETGADGVATYAAPVPEFRLHRVRREDGSVALPGRGPRIVLSVGSAARLVGADGSTLDLDRSGSCFVPARETGVRVEGPADLFVACPGE